MKLYPAIDLKGGRTVQLVGGEPGTERVSLPDPLAVARGWLELGFEELHVIDLDAALGSGSNADLVAGIVNETRVPVQVGGGVRNDEVAERLLMAGVARVIAGTRAVEDVPWATRLAETWPGRVMVAADVRDGKVVTRGWTETTALSATEFLARYDGVPLAGVLVTDVSREGQLQGADARLFEGLVEATTHPLQAAGGVTSLQDLRDLAGAGVSGAVLGMSIYTGAIDAAAALAETKARVRSNHERNQ